MTRSRSAYRRYVRSVPHVGPRSFCDKLELRGERATLGSGFLPSNRDQPFEEAAAARLRAARVVSVVVYELGERQDRDLARTQVRRAIVWPLDIGDGVLHTRIQAA